MPISLPDMLIPKYRTSQLPILPLLPLMPRSDKFKNIKSRYMVPVSKDSIKINVEKGKIEWKKIYGS
jgi:hypothetical protein